MELPRTPHDLVTPLAVVRSVRRVSLKELGRRVGVKYEDVRDWERGEARIPSQAMTKRLGLALGWPWEDIAGAHLDPGDAQERLMRARKHASG